MEYTLIEVGKRHPIFKPGNPEAVYFDYDKAGARVTIALEGPTSKEIEAVRKGPLAFCLAKIETVIYVVADFEGSLSFDMAYSIHLVSPEHKQIPEEPEEGYGIGIEVCLLDSQTGIIKGLRYVGTGTEFTRAFKRYLEEQLHGIFTKEGYDDELAEIARKHTAKDIMKLSSHRYKVGEAE